MIWKNGEIFVPLIYFIFFASLFFPVYKVVMFFFFNSIEMIILHIDVFYQFFLCNFINFGF